MNHNPEITLTGRHSKARAKRVSKISQMSRIAVIPDILYLSWDSRCIQSF